MWPGSNLAPLSGPFRFPGCGWALASQQGGWSRQDKVLGLGQPVSRVSGKQIKEAPLQSSHVGLRKSPHEMKRDPVPRASSVHGDK